ncbi:MAG: hypothetical protein GXO37_06195, partial [Chloroflexi bacterium]|nr:hypothetical protein [Chloroflexota bacterium]
PATESEQQRMVASLLEHEWFRVYPEDVRPSMEDYARFPAVLQPSGRWTRLFYWYFVTLPLRVVPAQWDFAWQLRLLRGMSVLLFAVTIWVAWQAAREVFGPRHPLARLAPLSLMLLPGFAEPMSLLNDDVGAAFGGTLFVWAVARLLRRGLTIREVAFALGAAWVASQMKRTVVPMLAVLPFALILAWRPRRVRWAPWALSAGLALGAAVAVLGWGDPAHWYHDRVVAIPLRVSMDDAPDGQWVFRLPSTSIEMGQWLPSIIYIYHQNNTPLRLTFWMWSDEPGQVRLPRLCNSSGGLWQPIETCAPEQIVEIGPQPKYFEINLDPVGGRFVRLEITPFTGQNLGYIYIDALSLRAAHDAEAPELLRNGSAEQAGPRLKPLAARILPAGSLALPVVLAAWLEPTVLLQALRPTGIMLFRTFWGFFARAKVFYLGRDGTYAGLLLLSILSVFGLLRRVVREWKRLEWRLIISLGLSGVIVWFMTFSFVLGYLHDEAHMATWFRYAFPAAFPTMLMIILGWYEWLHRYQRLSVILCFLVGLNILAWLSLGLYFYPPPLSADQAGFIIAIVLFSWLGWSNKKENWLREG